MPVINLQAGYHIKNSHDAFQVIKYQNLTLEAVVINSPINSYDQYRHTVGQSLGKTFSNETVGLHYIFGEKLQIFFHHSPNYQEVHPKDN